MSWDSYITTDPRYPLFHKKIQHLVIDDPYFSELLALDARATYSFEREKKFPNRNVFLEKAEKDLIEQCVSYLVLAKKGYRYLFYPGEQYSSVKYANQKLLDRSEQISMIHVFLSFEKKKLISVEV